ncbi:MAG: DUF7577 domain-containing protein [Erysipelotrichaceae bacterium]
MKSVKPGRAPSAMGATGSIIAIIFGIFWMFFAASIGAPDFFVMFGLLFVGVAIVQFVYHYKNATSKNRFSVVDITDESEEEDPWNARMRNGEPSSASSPKDVKYCPFCGAAMDPSFRYCPKCGKEQPQ